MLCFCCSWRQWLGPRARKPRLRRRLRRLQRRRRLRLTTARRQNPCRHAARFRPRDRRADNQTSRWATNSPGQMASCVRRPASIRKFARRRRTRAIRRSFRRPAAPAAIRICGRNSRHIAGVCRDDLPCLTGPRPASYMPRVRGLRPSQGHVSPTSGGVAQLVRARES